MPEQYLGELDPNPQDNWNFDQRQAHAADMDKNAASIYPSENRRLYQQKALEVRNEMGTQEQAVTALGHINDIVATEKAMAGFYSSHDASVFTEDYLGKSYQSFVDTIKAETPDAALQQRRISMALEVFNPDQIYDAGSNPLSRSRRLEAVVFLMSKGADVSLISNNALLMFENPLYQKELNELSKTNPEAARLLTLLQNESLKRLNFDINDPSVHDRQKLDYIGRRLDIELSKSSTEQNANLISQLKLKQETLQNRLHSPNRNLPPK